MKTISSILLTGYFLLITIFSTNAQSIPADQGKSIEPYRLEISHIRTTNIIFPFAIVSVDRGSKDVLTQKASGVENILQVKAVSDTFIETNLTVVTADGKLNSFLLSYSIQPKVLNFSLAFQKSGSGAIFLSPEKVNEAEVKAYAMVAAAEKKNVRGIKDEDADILIQMTGFFIHEDVMYCRMMVLNRSNINYDIDQLRFFIRDQKKAKRTASQEIEINPVYVEGLTNKIPGMVGWNFVYALPKFTIPDKKYLAIQLMEKNGGRHLNLKVKNKTIIKAAVLPVPVEQANYESIINL